MKFVRSLLAIAGFLVLGVSYADEARSYPNHAINLIVPFSPGGSTDQIARIFSEKISEKLKVPVIILNKPGAGTIVGTNEVARAKPDGYTLLLNVSTSAIQPNLYDNLPYDIKRDFVPVSLLAKIPILMYSNVDFKPKNVRELIVYNKDEKNRVRYATPGPASMGGLAGALFNDTAKTNLEHIPFNSGTQALMDVIGGHMELYWGTVAQGYEQYKAKKLNVLAVASPQRSKLLPDIPTIKEQGVDIVVEEWFGILAPQGTPQAIVDKLSTTIQGIVKEGKFGKGSELFEFVGSDPQQFATYMQDQTSLWGGVIKRLGIKAK